MCVVEAMCATRTGDLGLSIPFEPRCERNETATNAETGGTWSYHSKFSVDEKKVLQPAESGAVHPRLVACTCAKVAVKEPVKVLRSLGKECGVISIQATVHSFPRFGGAVPASYLYLRSWSNLPRLLCQYS